MKGSEAQINLFDTLTAANDAYRAGNPIMSDTVYDRTLDELRRTDSDNKFLHTVEPEKSDRAKVKHSAPMLSTEKAYTFAEIEKFIARCEAAAREIGLEDEVLYRISPKLDGIAAHCKNEGEQLLSRGDGEYGFDITDAMDKGLVIQRRLVADNGPGEIVIDRDYFETFLADKYSHPRNFVSGAILSETLSSEAREAFNSKVIFFYPFFAFQCGSNDDIYLKDEISEESLNTLCRYFGPDFQFRYPTDGLVLEVTDPDLKKHLGSTSHHHRWQIAFKRKGETAETIVTGIRWQVGRTGVVTPVIQIEPITISGATINNVTGHNAEYVVDHGIGLGTRLRIIRSGEVIPKVDAVLEATEVVLPIHCPECGTILHRRGVSLVCYSANCVVKYCRQKEHFFKILEIKGFGPAAIEKLATVPLVHFFEQMDVNHYVGFGFGMKQSVNLNDAIQARKAKPVNPAKFLSAFGIDGLGESTAKKILDAMWLEDLLFATPDDLIHIPSVGEITAHSIAAGLQENLTVIKILMGCFKFETDHEPGAGVLAGYKVVFSGKMEFGSRKTIAELAKKQGAEVQSSITSATTHLVCGANVGEAKTDKAAKLKVMVLSEEYFLEIAAAQ